jgi:TolB protein
MKTKKTFLVILMLMIFVLACTPINLSLWLTPFKNSLREVFLETRLITPQATEVEKDIATITETESPEAVISATDTPEPTQTAIATLAADFTATPSSTPSGKIIFTCQVDNNSNHDQICMINADGTGYTQLTNDLDHEHFYPSWAPDGKSFVYSGNQTGSYKIYEVDLQGNSKMIGDVDGDLYAPMISPDGTKIIYTHRISETEQYIGMMDRDGGRAHNASNYYDAKDPVWSPDGSKIIFTSLQDNTPQVDTMNKNGSNIQKVSQLSGLRGRPDWSVDYAIATFSGEQGKQNHEIVLLELGGALVTLTSGGDNLSPSFSPDGQWIAFMSYRDNFWEADGCEIYIMRKDGTDVQRLTNNTYCDYQPRWGN